MAAETDASVPLFRAVAKLQVFGGAYLIVSSILGQLSFGYVCAGERTSERLVQSVYQLFCGALVQDAWIPGTAVLALGAVVLLLTRSKRTSLRA